MLNIYASVMPNNTGGKGSREERRGRVGRRGEGGKEGGKEERGRERGRDEGKREGRRKGGRGGGGRKGGEREGGEISIAPFTLYSTSLIRVYKHTTRNTICSRYL